MALGRTPQQSSRAEGQPRRIPVGQRDVLTAKKNPGFVRRFVNDEPGRIERFKDAGYNIVTDEAIGDEALGAGSAIGSSANKHVGHGQRAVLMEIREDWYNEDQASKAAKVKALEDTIQSDVDQEAKGLTKQLGGKPLAGITISRQ